MPSVAFDVGPLAGHRTGIGAGVAALHDELLARPDVTLVDYLLSFRTRPVPPTRRLPLPAAVAHRLWARVPWPRVDGWLGEAEVVHGTNYVVPPTRRPALVSVYDTWFLRHPTLANETVRRAGDVLRSAVRRGAWVHASSQATADSIGDVLGTDRVVMIHLGPLAVPAAAPAGPAGLDRPFVLALGTQERRKNYPHLVRAFARAAAGIDVDLVVAGAATADSGEFLAAVDAVPASVSRRIRVLGPVDDATKGWLLRHATALAYPSLDEGFGFPILEAQGLDVPVVATARGWRGEVGGSGVHLVALDDVDALAGAIADVVTDDTRRRQLIAAGRANLARFSWSATADRMTTTYRHLAAGSDPR